MIGFYLVYDGDDVNNFFEEFVQFANLSPALENEFRTHHMFAESMYDALNNEYFFRPMQLSVRKRITR